MNCELKYLDILDWVSIGVLGVLFLAQLYFYARYMAAPARRLRRDRKKSTMAADTMENAPGVSVVLCAHNEAYNISQYLQAILTQDWPEYEVIVVDDGSEDETRAMIERYMVHDPRLHMTFVPYGARVGSTKKLALTLAAKAAKYDYLLLTDADCVPESNQWIRTMMQGFGKVPSGQVPSGPGGQYQSTKDIVLGFSPYFAEKGFKVEAIDGSEELVKIARKETGLPVRQMYFEELDEDSKYDAIWACSSILHLKKDELKGVFAKMLRAVKHRG